MKYSNVKKILIIKLRGIGDVILATIVLDNLREEFPNSEIDFLTERASVSALEGLSQISNVLQFKRKPILDRIKIFFKIRKNKYDLILDLFSNPVSAQITYFSGARYKIGFPYKGRKYAYNIYGPSEREKFHNADLHLKLLEFANIFHSFKSLYFHLSKTDLNFIDKYFNENQLNDSLSIILSPSGGWQSKRIEPEIFAKIGDYLIEKLSCKIIIIWGPSDKDDAIQIKHLMKNDSLLAPPTSLSQMGAFMNKTDIVIANCSGPMHIATAVGTATLSIHGPTIPWLQGAYGNSNETLRKKDLDCIGCNLLECKREHECFMQLSMESVLEKVKLLISKNNIHYD